MIDQMAVVAVVIIAVSGGSTLVVALVDAARRRQQRRQAKAGAVAQRLREEREAAAAKEARRARACEAMDRATLVDHMTEFAAGWRPDPTILADIGGGAKYARATRRDDHSPQVV